MEKIISEIEELIRSSEKIKGMVEENNQNSTHRNIYF